MIADPVILADIDERLHTALEECCNVVVCRAELVHGKNEGGADIVIAGGEIGGYGGIDADLGTDGGTVEVGCDVPTEGVLDFAEQE